MGLYIPFATTWMDLEGIVLREIRQTEKDNSAGSRFCVESKGTKLIEENGLVVVRERMGKRSQNV